MFPHAPLDTSWWSDSRDPLAVLRQCFKLSSLRNARPITQPMPNAPLFLEDSTVATVLLLKRRWPLPTALVQESSISWQRKWPNDGLSKPLLMRRKCNRTASYLCHPLPSSGCLMMLHYRFLHSEKHWIPSKVRVWVILLLSNPLSLSLSLSLSDTVN